VEDVTPERGTSPPDWRIEGDKVEEVEGVPVSISHGDVTLFASWPSPAAHRVSCRPALGRSR